jgi:hypothetical protein
VSLRTAPMAAVPVIAAFYLAVVLAPTHHSTLLTTGTGAIIACWIIAGRCGVDAGAGREMIGVFLACAGAIAMPVAAQAPIPVRTMVAIGVGILATEAVWAARRFPVFPPTQRQGPLTRARLGILFGVLMAILVSFIATIPLAIAFFSSAADRAQVRTLVPSIYGAYLLGGASAGLVVGLLRPLSRWPLGTMLLGVFAGVCVYAAIAPVAELIRDEPQSLPTMMGIALACGLLAGPPAALAMRYGDEAGRAFDQTGSASRAA